MLELLRWASIVLFAALSLFLILFGTLYFGVQDLLSFHAAAVPDAALDAVRPLYFALMKLVGGAAIALGFLTAYMALFPMRRGVALAGTTLFIAHAIPLATAAYVAETLAAETGAPTSWHVMGVLLAVDTAAFLAHVLGGKTALVPTFASS